MGNAIECLFVNDKFRLTHWFFDFSHFHHFIQCTTYGFAERARACLPIEWRFHFNFRLVSLHSTYLSTMSQQRTRQQQQQQTDVFLIWMEIHPNCIMHKPIEQNGRQKTSRRCKLYCYCDEDKVQIVRCRENKKKTDRLPRKCKHARSWITLLALAPSRLLSLCERAAWWS